MPGTAIRLDVADGTATITLDGPASRNALDAAAAGELIAVCDRVDADDSVGVVVVTGAHGAFCSGADTTVLDRLRSVAPHEAYDGLDHLYAAFRRVGSLAVPTVAVVDGPAIGAGVNLALAADSLTPSEMPQTVARATAHLAADPARARALVETLRRTVLDPSAWDRAVEIERARQMWSLSRPRPDTRQHPAKES